jgi:hypothetical protein
MIMSAHAASNSIEQSPFFEVNISPVGEEIPRNL